MKRLLFIIISSLFYISSWAEETSIQLFKDNADDRVKDDRSLSIEPTATYDGNTVHIYSDIPIESLQITVKDVQKNIIYSTILTGNSKHYEFDLLELKEGECMLELIIGEKIFYGYF